MIIASNLTKRYENGVLALDAFNLVVEPGEIYCLLGANGAGKTTIINLFMGFVRPTSGYAKINGIDVIKQPLESKKHVAYVSERVMLYSDFTSRQNLEFFANLGGRRGLTKDESYAFLREVGVPEAFFERKVKYAPKGMRQQLLIAIANVRDTPSILLDEPTSGLDPEASEEILRLVHELRGRRKAILLATKDIFGVRGIGDRVGIIKEGRKVIEYTRDDLENEDLQSLYLYYMGQSQRARFQSNDQ